MSASLSTNQRPQTFAERRSSVRRDCSIPAFIKFSGSGLIACRMINVSSGGALLELKDIINLPKTFRINVPMELFEAECEVRHQTGKHVGIMYTDNLREALARFG